MQMLTLSIKEAKDRVEEALNAANDGSIPKLNLIKLLRTVYQEGVRAGAVDKERVDFEMQERLHEAREAGRAQAQAEFEAEFEARAWRFLETKIRDANRITSMIGRLEQELV